MRLERLSFQALGPYVDRQDIDFNALSNHHLFLIRGETGAGKTVILDAITYALFHKSSSGERGDFESMRSRFAKEEDITFVELIMVVNSRRYRFYREIRVRKKRNGEYAVKQLMDGGEYRNGVYEPFFENCKQRLLEEKAEQLIGLTHQQFIQVMMLPQGKFEQLLISKSEEKQEILKSLFQIENWEAICQQLVEKQRVCKASLDEVQQTMQIKLAQTTCTSFEELQAKSLMLHKQYEQQQGALKEEHSLLQQKQKQLEEQKQLHELHKRYLKQKQVYADLLESDQRIAKDKEILQKQEQLEKIKPYFIAYKQAEAEYTKRTNQKAEILEKRLKVLRQHQEIYTKVNTLPVLKNNLQKLDNEQTNYLQAEANVLEIQVLEQEYKEKQKHLQKDGAAQQQIEQQMATLKQQIDQLQVDMKTHEECMSAYPSLYQKEQQFVQLKKIVDELHVLDQQLSTCEKEKMKLHKQVEDTKLLVDKACNEHEHYYQIYLSNSAALLAQLLKEGSPCPVCGSCHHEIKLHIQEQHVEVTQLQEYKQRMEKCQNTLRSLEYKGKQLQHEQEKLKIEKQTLYDESLLLAKDGYDAEAHHAINCALQNSKKAEELRQQTQKEQEAKQQQYVLLGTKKAKILETMYETKKALAIIETKMEEKRSDMKGESKEYANFQERLQIIKTDYEAVANEINVIETSKHDIDLALMEVETTYKTIVSELAGSEQQLQDSKQAYYALGEHVHTYQMLDFQNLKIEQLRKEIHQFEQQKTSIEATLQELEHQLANRRLEDLCELEQNVQKVEEAYQVHMRAFLAIENEQKHLQDTQKKYAIDHKRYEDIHREYIKLSEFVRAMRGDSSIGIERYVLGIMLSSITQVANQLLQGVHNGRYLIHRSDEASGRTRKFGLELSIYDAYSCSMRSVISLSGGEKFLVSLALSLALSIVVQARSGGIRMETMFIDEGFGSLDEQSIGDALQVLTAMSKTKSMIGIISHVELLKENIPYGIRVQKDAKGSQLQLLL